MPGRASRGPLPAAQPPVQIPRNPRLRQKAPPEVAYNVGQTSSNPADAEAPTPPERLANNHPTDDAHVWHPRRLEFRPHETQA
jgi:hypothetical protein